MCAACEHSCALRLSLLAHVQANTLKKRFVCAATWSSHVCVAVFVRQHRCVRLLCARSELQVLQLVVSRPWPTVLWSPVLFFWWQPLTDGSTALKGLSGPSSRARQYNSAAVFFLYTGEKACCTVVFHFSPLFVLRPHSSFLLFHCSVPFLSALKLFALILCTHWELMCLSVFYHQLPPTQKITCPAVWGITGLEPRGESIHASGQLHIVFQNVLLV